MSAWLRRFGLHLAAAVGATSLFVAAAAVGANQARPASEQSQVIVGEGPALASASPGATPAERPRPRRTPPAAVPAASASPSPRPASGAGARQTPRVIPERSLAGTIGSVDSESIDVTGPAGRTWRVTPAPGALLRLNGRPVKLDALQPGDTVVILGQAGPAAGGQNQGPRTLPFTAHAITARRT